MPTLVASDSTFLVSIDEIIPPEPPRLGNVRGHTITVVSPHPGNVVHGQRFFFFVTGWLYGYSMAVLEVCRTEIDADSSQVIAAIDSAVHEIADEALIERLVAAEKVVVGNVLSVAPYHGGTPQLVAGSEHNPEWWIADIHVTSVLKGHEVTTLQALYAHSVDVAWAGAPKLIAGTDTVLVLDEFRNEEYNTAEYTVRHPLDVQPRSELERIRALLAALRRRK